MYGTGAYREIATLYFLSLFVLGTYVVFNLFVAIILQQIEVEDEASALSDEERAARVDGDGGKLVRAVPTDGARAR